MKLLKKFWPLILIFVVWFIFSSPYFLKAKVPFSSTYLVNFFSPWVSYPDFSSPVKNNAMPDVISQIYPWKSLTISIWKNMQVPLWNPYSFSGTPLLANYQSAVLSPFNLLFFILPFIDAWSILILLQPLLAGIFMYLFLQSLKLKKEGSVIGSLAFMFCGFITTWMAYGTLPYAILFLPLTLFAIEKFFEKGKNRFLILYAFTFPLSFFSGHFQISIYFFLFILAYLVFKFFQTKNKPNTFCLILYTILGVLLSLPQLLPSIELYMQSLRSGIFAAIEVIPWGYFSTFVAPDFLGNPVTRNDWFGHYAEWNAYIGLIPLMLAFYSIFWKREKYVFFFALMALLSILFSFNTPFLNSLILLKVPVLATSAASRIIVLFSFSLSVLAAIGFEKLFDDLKNKELKHVTVFFSLFIVVFAVLWAVVIFKLIMPLDKIIIARQNLILPTALYIAFIVVVSVTVFFIKALNKSKFPYLTVASLLIILLTAFDLLRFSTKWMPFDPKNLVYPNVPIVGEFKKISGYDRTFGGLGGEATTYYRLPSIEGYDAIYIKRYGEFIAFLQNGKFSESSRSVVSLPKNGKYTPKAINLLGIKYIVNKISDGTAPWNFPYWTYPPGTFPTIYQDSAYQIFENNNVFPRAFLVGKYVVSSNPQVILATMFNKKFDLRKEVVLESNPDLNLTLNSGNAKIISYKPNIITIGTNSKGSSLLFLSDTYYPGWEAYVDGRKTEIYRTDYTFRSVFIPGGKHTVEFIYNPLSFRLGIAGFTLGLILIVVVEFMRRKRPILFPKT